MYQDLLRDQQLLGFLLQCDGDLAEKARVAGCPGCGGKLHRANYPRKPRGGPSEIESGQSWRLSFCCAEDGCRSRMTPTSLRFLGRTVYFSTVMILTQAMRHGATPARVSHLEELVGVSARTLRRWRRWWQTIFATSRFWKEARARFRNPILPCALPHALLDCFPGDARSRLIDLLRFLSPITGGSAYPERAR